MGATIVVDAFWGDAGKGKMSAYLSRLLGATLCVRAGTGTNAGHSFYLNGAFVKARLIPMGVLSSRTKGIISSGVCVDPEVFLHEIHQYDVADRAFVDFRCPIIEPEHIDFEKKDDVLNLIDSTKSGTGRARAQFVMRRGRRALDVEELQPFLIDGVSEINKHAAKHAVVVEGSQGTYLSLYASNRYPYVTSDNCTTAAFIDDANLNWRLVDDVVLLVKCMPTCVGNGPLPHEMEYEEIKNLNLEEFGVNTGRPKRRSRMIDEELLAFSIMVNGPTCLALTFCDQLAPSSLGARGLGDVDSLVLQIKDRLEDRFNVPVKFLSTGPNLDDVVVVG